MFRGSSEPIETLGVASLNMLLDKTRSEKLLEEDPQYVEPQHLRIESLAQTLGSLPVSLDVVLLQEAHITKEHNNVEDLADLLGLKYRYYFPHNRQGEHLAIIGNKVDRAEAFSIGDNRIAVEAWIGDIACYNMHNRAGSKNIWLREGQMGVTVDRANKSGAMRMIAGGDTNDIYLAPSRGLLRNSGFTPVHRLKGPIPYLPGRMPPTYPTTNYREIMWSSKKKKALPFGVAIDIIDVRGFSRRDVLKVGTVMTEKSDHRTLYAELAV
jgi:hypothetical protein